ncbi:MAG: RluA family pseudouridine synthase [Herpetosiphon sp.]
MFIDDTARRLVDQPPYRRAIVPALSAGLSIAELCSELDLTAPEATLTIINRGGVWLNKHRVLDPLQIPEPNDLLTVHFPPNNSYPDVQLLPTMIIYEDEDICVVNKPPGVFVNVTPWDIRGNLLYALKKLLTDRDGIPYPLHLAHQLDKDTSGVLIATKNPRVNAALQRTFASHSITKRYLGICSGVPAQPDWTTETGHGRGAHGLFRLYDSELVGQLLPVGTHRIKYAATRFNVLKRWNNATLIAAEPITGRTHQIRLHLSSLGHPLFGDQRYHGPMLLGDTTIYHHLLHAHELELLHPRTQIPLHLAAPLPSLFELVLGRLAQSAT